MLTGYREDTGGTVRNADRILREFEEYRQNTEIILAEC